jgi:hypothetical protein
MKIKTPLFMIVNLRLPNKFLFYLLTLTGAVLAVASAATIYPVNNGFEQPDLGSGGLAYQYSPSSPGWTFTPECCSGIAANGSDFNLAGRPTATTITVPQVLPAKQRSYRGVTGLSVRRAALGSRKR